MDLTDRRALGAQNVMRDGFRQIVVGVAATEQVTLSTGALGILFEWLDNSGVDENAGTDELLEMQLKLVRIVHSAAVEAQTTGDTEVSESVVKTIRRQLCPLPPWIQHPCDD